MNKKSAKIALRLIMAGSDELSKLYNTPIKTESTSEGIKHSGVRLIPENPSVMVALDKIRKGFCMITDYAIGISAEETLRIWEEAVK